MMFGTYLRRATRPSAVATMAIGVLALAAPAAAQTPSLLEITSPADGSIVNPGQTVMIAFASPASATFIGVIVVPEGPIGGSHDVATELPAQLAITIPTKISSRDYMVSVTGRTTSGQAAAAEILIRVERPDMPYRISPLSGQVLFDVQGGDASLHILGHFPDGNVAEVTRSSNMAFASSNPNVATVDASGRVSAIAPGKATITATYGPPEQRVRAMIPVNVPAPPFELVPASVNFGEQAVGTPTSQQIVLTNTSAGPLGIVTITTSGEFSATDTCVAASPIAPTSTCAITVTFTPTATGQRSGTLKIANSRNIGAATFSLLGAGIAP